MALHPYARIYPDKTAAPAVSNDTSQGYEQGDVWIDVNNDKVYQCIDPAAGAAVWVELTGGGGGWVGTATSDLNMSSFDINNIDTANFILTPGGTLAEGSVQWAVDDETLQVGLHGGVVLQLGQETMILIKNQTGAPLTDGKVVAYDGAIGVSGRMKAKYAIANGTQNAKLFLGVITETVADGNDGFVTMFGKVRGIQTNGANYGETWADGDILWISPTTAGGFTNVEPVSPNLRVPIAVVVTAHATMGTIFVRMTNGSYLNEAHDAKIVSPANKEMLSYNSGNGMWENGPISDLTTLGQFQDINRFGFIASYDGSTGTTISFDPATYTLTLTDSGAGWGYYFDGVACKFTGNRTIVLSGTPPVKSNYYIYFDSTTGVLQQNTNVWSLETAVVPVAMLLWDNALTPKYWLGDERHTASIDRRAHVYLHSNFGSRWNSGGIPFGYTVSPVSPVDTENTIGMSAAIIFDEDIKVTLSALSDPDGTTNSYVILYKAGGTWSWVYSKMPYGFVTSGYIQFDNSGTMTEGQNAKFYNTYLILTNFAAASPGVGCYQIIHGKQEFSSLTTAQAEDPLAFDFTGFPIVECVIAWQFTWQTNSSYSSQGKCRLAAAPKRIGGTIGSSAATGSNLQETVEDIVGNMVVDNTETGIAVTYDDALGKLNFDAQTAGDLRYALISSVREKLTANRTYYVRTDGSDSNTGLVNTAGGAFLTIQKAINVVSALDILTFDVTIQVADGTYSGALIVNGPWIGSGTVTIQGNTGTPGNVIITANSADGTILCKAGGRITLTAFEVRSSGTQHLIRCITSGNVSFSNIRFGTGGAHQIRVESNGSISATGNYSIVAAAAYHWAAVTGGQITVQNITLTITGTPAFSSAFVLGGTTGVVVATGNTYSGSATGPYYSLTSNSVLATAGAGVPGNSAGSVATGAQYL